MSSSETAEAARASTETASSEAAETAARVEGAPGTAQRADIYVPVTPAAASAIAVAVVLEHHDQYEPVSYTHLTLPTKA